MTEQERQALLNSILGAQTGSPTMDVLSNALAGTSRATQERLLESPLLVSTGVATPQQLTDSFSAWLNQRYADELQAAVEKYNADLSKIAEGLTEPRLVSSAANVIRSSPEYDFLDTQGLAAILDDIARGRATAEDFEIAATENDVESKLRAENPNYSIRSLFANVRQFERDAAEYRNNKLLYDTVTLPEAEAKAQALGDPPTVESVVSATDQRAALNEFYKDMGLEGLSLLPAPWEQFEISPEQALQLSGLSAGQFRPTRQEELQLRALQERAMGQETAARRAAAAQEAAAREPVPLSVMEQFREMQGRLDPLRRDVSAGGFGRGDISRAAQLGGRGSGRTTAASRRRAAGLEAPVPAGPRLPSAAERAMQAMITRRQNRPQQIADLFASELAAMGRTPFTEALAGQNLYGGYTS
jgi:hypothetical protein